ncbi:MAG: S9 family peptidase [Ignavibacteria bacterium]|nr:S9 family peptidase [Ignavibacteria bacterium]
MNTKFSKIYLFFLYFFFLTNISHYAFSQCDKLTLEDIYFSKKFFYKNYFNPYPMQDGKHYADFNDDGWLCSFAYYDGELKEKILPPLNNFSIFNSTAYLSDYEFSQDETKILLFVNSTPIYRRSKLSEIYIYFKQTNQIQRLDEGKIRHAEFSPDGNKVAYVKDNNIFIKNINDDIVKQITTDGKINEVINGVPDWVYEEEFGVYDCVVWSPDSRYLAYLRFDETNVKEYPLIKYTDIYPEVYKYKYPKAGEDNSIVSIFIYDIESGFKKEIDIGKDDKDFYIPRIKWTNSNYVFSFVKLNRLQNNLQLYHYNVETSEIQLILNEYDKYYIDESYDIWYLSDNSFIYKSERNGFSHLYLYDSIGQLRNQITKGNYDVEDIIAVNEKEKLIYFTARGSLPYDVIVFSINFDGNDKKQLFKNNGNNRITFSKNFEYVIYTFSDANTPEKISLYDRNYKFIRDIINNYEYEMIIKAYCFSEKEFFKFKNRDGDELYGWIMKPNDFKKNKKYPVLFYVYGGPGSNTVMNSYSNFGDMWARYLCQNGYIVVSVDGRGTGGRGSEFKKCTYMRLGILETQDQIDAAKYISSLSYVDSSRIGIWGWSFGGYMVCMCLTSSENVFKAGIAIAPLTDLKFYDNIYMERFMRRPKDNPEGYYNSSPINFADKLSGNLLLVHGSVDDNVHLQNTMQFAERLVDSKIQFEMQIYNNKEHSILGRVTRYHLFKKMSDFIFKNL